MLKQKIAVIGTVIAAVVIALSLNCVKKRPAPENDSKASYEQLAAKLSAAKSDSTPAEDTVRRIIKFYEKAKASRIKRLTAGKKIDIADQSLNDWNRSYLIFSVDDNNAQKSQWKNIRGRTPQKLKTGDISWRVYMAIDDSSWYIGLRVIDDKIVQPLIGRNYNMPYSGDCAEIFFVGAKDVFGCHSDFHDIMLDRRKHFLIMTSLDSNYSPSQDFGKTAFFQLELPASDSANCDFFPRYRNDILGEKMKDLPYRPIMITLQKNGYIAEVKIPLRFFESSVLKKIASHEPLKLGLDYLDYDKKNAEPQYDGFNPDNVFCPGNEEKEVNCPYFMGNVIFE